MRTGISLAPAKPSATVGIFAHNEQATIQQVIESFLRQEGSSYLLREVVVVCCGCTDSTVPIVRQMAANDRRIRLLARPRREGKVAAINEFLRHVDTDVLVLSGGDVVPASNTVELLISPFITDDQCMMTGPRVVGAASTREPRIIDHLHSLLWMLHHSVSMRRPKLGELVAIRRRVLEDQLPPNIYCDEALMESVVVNQGGTLKYIENALVYNFAPGSVAELYQQRRRIAAQHASLRKLRMYRPSTTDSRLILRALRTVPLTRLLHLMFLAALEAFARIHGRRDARRGRLYRLWPIIRPGSRKEHKIGQNTVAATISAPLQPESQ